MSGKTIERTRPEASAPNERAGGERAGGRAEHPLDAWLRRELQGICADTSEEPLPDEIAALAARLEARLREAGPGPGAGPDKPRTSDRRRKPRQPAE